MTTEKKPKTTFRTIREPLSLERKADLLTSIADGHAELAALDDRKKVAAKDFAAQIEEIEAEVKEWVRVARDGAVLRSIECEERVDIVHCAIRFYRLDTGEMVGERTMAKAEIEAARQPELPLEGGKVLQISPAAAPPLASLLPADHSSLTTGDHAVKVHHADVGGYTVQCGCGSFMAHTTLEALANVKRADIVQPWCPEVLAAALGFKVPTTPKAAKAEEAPADDLAPVAPPATMEEAAQLADNFVRGLRAALGEEHAGRCTDNRPALTGDFDDIPKKDGTLGRVHKVTCACGSETWITQRQLDALVPQVAAELAAPPVATDDAAFARSLLYRDDVLWSFFPAEHNDKCHGTAALGEEDWETNRLQVKCTCGALVLVPQPQLAEREAEACVRDQEAAAKAAPAVAPPPVKKGKKKGGKTAAAPTTEPPAAPPAGGSAA